MKHVKRILILLVTLAMLGSLAACRQEQEEEQIRVIPTVLKETPAADEDASAVTESDGEYRVPAAFFAARYPDERVLPVLLAATPEGAVVKVDAKSEAGTRTLALYTWRGTEDDPEPVLDLADREVLVYAAVRDADTLYLSLEAMGDGRCALEKFDLAQGPDAAGDVLREATLNDLRQIPGLALHDGHLYFWWTEAQGDATRAHLAVYDPASGETKELVDKTGHTLPVQSQILQLPNERFIFMFFVEGKLFSQGIEVDMFRTPEDRPTVSTWPYEGFEQIIFWRNDSYLFTHGWPHYEQGRHEMRRMGGDYPDKIFDAWPRDMTLCATFCLSDRELLLLGQDLTGDTRYFSLRAVDKFDTELTELTGLPPDRDLFAAARVEGGLVFYSQDPLERDLYCREIRPHE